MNNNQIVEYIQKTYAKFYKQKTYVEMAKAFRNGDVVGALIDCVARINMQLQPDIVDMCGIIETGRKGLMSAIGRAENPYITIRFDRMKSILTHELLHKLSAIIFVILDGEEPSPKIYEKCRIAVTEELELASILAPNFAILCELTGPRMDAQQCNIVADRMYNVIKQDDAVLTFAPVASLMASSMTPAEKMFALLGASVITMNQSVQVASQAILSLIDECDSMIAASIDAQLLQD